MDHSQAAQFFLAPLFSGPLFVYVLLAVQLFFRVNFPCTIFFLFFAHRNFSNGPPLSCQK